MNYFKDVNNDVFSYDDEQVAMGYGSNMTLITEVEATAIIAPVLTTEERVNQIELGITQYMDGKAAQRGYDSIINAALRAGLPNSPFHAEGVAYGEWMDNVWAYCYQVLAEVQLGARTEPTAMELMGELEVNVPLVLP